MLSYPTTKDAGTLLAVLPDWGEGIKAQAVYRTDLQTSRSGLEQRGQRRRKAILSMDYMTEDMGPDEARRRIEEVVAASRGKLIVPWWVSGVQLSQDMTSETEAVLASNPIAFDWESASYCFFQHPTLDPSFREMTGVSERNVALVNPGGTLIRYPAGTWIFPCLNAIRDKDAGLLMPQNERTNTERMMFRTL